MSNQTCTTDRAKATVIDMFVGDLHGNVDAFQKAIEEFEREGYENLILIGDYVDSRVYSDVEILHLLKEVIRYKRSKPNNVFLLTGNHDQMYISLQPEDRCSGFRIGIAQEIHNMFDEYSDLFQIAYQRNGYLATHAGITKEWFGRYYDRLRYHTRPYEDIKNDFAEILNRIGESADRWILCTISKVRGGYGMGGPIWADSSEMGRYDQSTLWRQIVG